MDEKTAHGASSLAGETGFGRALAGVDHDNRGIFFVSVITVHGRLHVAQAADRVYAPTNYNSNNRKARRHSHQGGPVELRARKVLVGAPASCTRTEIQHDRRRPVARNGWLILHALAYRDGAEIGGVAILSRSQLGRAI